MLQFNNLNGFVFALKTLLSIYGSKGLLATVLYSFHIIGYERNFYIETQLYTFRRTWIELHISCYE